MPIAKKRPHIIELLNIAVEQKKIVNESRTQILARPVSIWLKASLYTNKSFHHESVTHASIADELYEDTVTFFGKVFKDLFYGFVVASHFCERVLLTKLYQLLRIVPFVLGAYVLIMEAPRLDNVSVDPILFKVDIVSNVFFLLDGLLRLCGLYIRVCIEKAFNRELQQPSFVLRAGFIDVILTILSFSFSLSFVGLWIRIIRLMVLFSILTDLFPHLDVLLSGIASGLRGTFFTIILFVFTNIVYAGIGFIFFSVNDPFHFGTYPTALLAFFQLATFDNMSMIYFLNFGGCDSFPAEYDLTANYTLEELRVETMFGTLMLPQCSNPQPRPIISTIVFVSFLMIEGYVIVSMSLAAVAIGINERLEFLRHTEVYGQDEADEMSEVHREDMSMYPESVGGNSVYPQDASYSLAGASPKTSPRRDVPPPNGSAHVANANNNNLNNVKIDLSANSSNNSFVQHQTGGTGDGDGKIDDGMHVSNFKNPPKRHADGVVKFEIDNDVDSFVEDNNDINSKHGGANNYKEGNVVPDGKKSVPDSPSVSMAPKSSPSPASHKNFSSKPTRPRPTNVAGQSERTDRSQEGRGTKSQYSQYQQLVSSSPHSKRSPGNRNMNTAKAAKLLGNSDDAKEIKIMLKQIWKTTGNRSQSNDSFTEANSRGHGLFDAYKLAVVLTLRMSSWEYKVGYAACILGDVVAMLYSIDLENPLSANALVIVAWIFQVVFLIDTALRLFCRWAGSVADDCLKDGWFWFSVVISLCNIIALSIPDTQLDWVAILLMIRLVRSIRIFKTISLYYVDMKIILTSFSSAFMSLLYVLLLVFLYFSYFAVASVMLFKRAVPFHFGDLGAAYRTLLNMMSFDNWGDVMKQCMYGCRYYGYNSGVTKFDHSCNWQAHPVGEGMGYFAPIFFIVFEIVTGMVLTSLLVGVIIKSLELLKEENNEEKEIRDKLVRVKKKYHLDNDTVTVYLKLFEVIDKNSNGRLVFPELAIMLNVLEMDSNEQFEFFLKVDSDRSGQIDFSEFAEMMALISLSKRVHRGMQARAKKAPTKKEQDKLDTVKKDLELITKRVLPPSHTLESFEVEGPPTTPGAAAGSVALGPAVSTRVVAFKDNGSALSSARSGSEAANGNSEVSGEDREQYQQQDAIVALQEGNDGNHGGNEDALSDVEEEPTPAAAAAAMIRQDLSTRFIIKKLNEVEQKSTRIMLARGLSGLPLNTNIGVTGARVVPTQDDYQPQSMKSFQSIPQSMNSARSVHGNSHRNDDRPPPPRQAF